MRNCLNGRLVYLIEYLVFDLNCGIRASDNAVHISFPIAIICVIAILGTHCLNSIRTSVVD